MTRSSKKGPYIDQRLLVKVNKQKKTNDNKQINTYARHSDVDPDMVGHTLGIHNGRTFMQVYVTENMVGHKIGEFALTRKFRGHGKVTKRISEKT